MCKTFIAYTIVFSALAAGPSGAQETLVLSAAGGMERIGQDGIHHGSAKVEIKSAKNEVESFQVVVSAPVETILVTDVTASDLIGGDGSRIGRDSIRLYREEYVRVRRSTPRAELPPGLYTGPLVPFINPLTGKPIEPRRQHRERWGAPIVTVGHEMYAVPFEVFRGQSQPLWVDVHVPKEASAGTYGGTITVTTKDGTSRRIPVSLTVWDFTLPDGPTLSNHFGSFRNIVRYFDVRPGSDEYREIEMRYCEALAEHRINPPIPRSLLPEVGDDGSLRIIPERDRKLKEFMTRFHVTDFEIPRAPFKDPTGTNRDKVIRYLKDYYGYAKKNGWDKRAYYYMHDEPNLPENYEHVRKYGRLVHESVPGLKCLVVEQTYPQNPSWPDIDPAVDIWCPLWAFIDRETILEKISHGDEVWSYTALTQRAPSYHPDYEKVKDLDPPYWHIDRPLTVYRVPAWINWQYNITGLLYWTTVTTVLDPWNNPAFSHFGRHFNGGGFLLYPGTPCGIDGPVAGIRLKNLRDGMEDYEYFVILEKLAGRKAVTEIVDEIAPNWWNFSKTPRDFLGARERLAEKILQYKKRR